MYIIKFPGYLRKLAKIEDQQSCFTRSTNQIKIPECSLKLFGPLLPLLLPMSTLSLHVIRE